MVHGHSADEVVAEHSANASRWIAPIDPLDLRDDLGPLVPSGRATSVQPLDRPEYLLPACRACTYAASDLEIKWWSREPSVSEESPQLHCGVLAVIAANTWHVSAIFERAIIGANVD